jgi:hypothetical protein
VCIFQLISNYKLENLEKNLLYKLELHKNRNPVPSEEVVDLSENLNDDRNFISIDDKTILIIEDASFAEVLLQVA